MADLAWSSAPLFLLLCFIYAVIRFVVSEFITSILCRLRFFQKRKTRKCVKETGTLIYYLVASTMEFIFVDQYQLLFHLERCWENYGEPPSALATRIYKMESTYYVTDLFYCFFYYSQVQEVFEAFFHHFMTLGLLMFSYHVDATRVGIVITLLHNVSEIIVCYAKAVLYMNFVSHAIVAFSVVVVTWLLMRLIYFPLFVIRSIIIDCYRLVIKTQLGPSSAWVTSVSFLVALLIMHIYWFRKFIQLLTRLNERQKEKTERRKERKRLEEEEEEEEEMLRQVREEEERERLKWGSFDTVTENTQLQSGEENGENNGGSTSPPPPHPQSMSSVIHSSESITADDSPTSSPPSSSTSPSSLDIHERHQTPTYNPSMHFTPQILFT